MEFAHFQRSAFYDAFGVALQSTDTLYVARRGTSHVGDNGELSLWRHNGSSWVYSTLVDDATYDDRNPGGGAVSTGTLLVFYARYNAGTDTWNDIRILRSTDGGTNWTDVGAIATGTDEVFSPYGPLVEMPGGVLMQTFYGRDGSTRRIWAQFSTDDGLTWGSEVVVVSSGTLEPTEGAAVFLDGTVQADSRLVLVTRDNGGVMRQYRSSDGGATWTDQGTLSFSVGSGTDVSPWLYKDGATLYLLYTKRSTKQLQRYVASGDVHTDKANWSFDQTLWTSVTTNTSDFGYPGEAGGYLFFYDQFNGKTDLYSTLTGGITVPFDYSTIFAGAEAGEVWLPDGTSHFQDAARTTAAGADDPIGSASGDQAHFNANQSDAGLKPTLRQDAGGKWYFEHAGDYLVAGAVSDWIYLHDSGQNAYICAAVSFGAVANPDAIYSLAGTSAFSAASQGGVLAWDDRSSASFNERLRYYVATGGIQRYDVGANDVLAPQTDAFIEIIRNGTTITGYVNNVQAFTGTQSGTASSNSANPLAIGAVGGGAFPLTGRIYGLLITDTIPSAVNRQAIQADMNARLVTPRPSLGNTATLAGTDPVEPVERVLIHRDNAGTLILEAQIVPASNGDWTYLTDSTDDHYVTYLAANYPTWTYGPYTPA